jgi:glycosyltransferase involved in cell wall biosynthesis
MKAKSTNILYTYTAWRSFVRTDIQLLKHQHQVSTYHFKTEQKILTPISFILQFFHLLFTGWRYDAFACFFAGYHSILPSLFARMTGKKCILFLGGTDCFNYPSFHYGNFTRKWYGRATCISVRQATMLVPVSANLVHSQSGYYTIDGIDQGIYHWCAPLKTPYKIIGLEYDDVMFAPTTNFRPPLSFITVAFGIQGTSFIRKGIDKVLMIAAHLPEATFTIIGCKREEFPVPVPVNVNLIPPVPYQELPSYYNQHQFYLQLSIAEGFPSAICEAILCGCIPIGSDVAAIPDIISDHGFLVSHRDDNEIMDTIHKAIAYEQKEIMAMNGRAHIITTYGKGKRASALMTLFSKN